MVQKLTISLPLGDVKIGQRNHPKLFVRREEIYPVRISKGAIPHLPPGYPAKAPYDSLPPPEGKNIQKLQICKSRTYQQKSQKPK